MESTFGSGFTLLGYFIIWLISLPLGFIIWKVSKKNIISFISSWIIWFFGFSIYVYSISEYVDDKKSSIIYALVSFVLSIVSLKFVYKKSTNFKKTTIGLIINLIILTAAIWLFNR